MDTENVSYANNTMLVNSIKKSEIILPTLPKKPYSFMRKNDLKKTPYDLEKLHPNFSEGKEERPAGYVGVFCQNLGITAYTSENYSNFKSNFSFNNGSIFEIHDFRTSGKASFNSVSNNNNKNKNI